MWICMRAQDNMFQIPFPSKITFTSVTELFELRCSNIKGNIFMFLLIYLCTVLMSESVHCYNVLY
jgi:hypothetical protein